MVDIGGFEGLKVIVVLKVHNTRITLINYTYKLYYFVKIGRTGIATNNKQDENKRDKTKFNQYG